MFLLQPPGHTKGAISVISKAVLTEVIPDCALGQMGRKREDPPESEEAAGTKRGAQLLSNRSGRTGHSVA